MPYESIMANPLEHMIANFHLKDLVSLEPIILMDMYSINGVNLFYPMQDDLLIVEWSPVVLRLFLPERQFDHIIL